MNVVAVTLPKGDSRAAKDQEVIAVQHNCERQHKTGAWVTKRSKEESDPRSVAKDGFGPGLTTVTEPNLPNRLLSEFCPALRPFSPGSLREARQVVQFETGLLSQPADLACRKVV